MAEKKEVATVGTVAQLKQYLASEDVKAKFQEVLGAKAPQFMASITNAVANSTQLKKCTPVSIMSAAFVAAAYDLPIDSNLGFSALVPYTNSKQDANGAWVKVSEAQFQIMYKGFIQLAIRSGYYETMSYATVYEDELKSYNPILGECEFVTDFSNCTQRLNGETDKIVGYYAQFVLKDGFKKSLYMTKREVEQHAMKYSTAYRYDLNKGKQSSQWTVNFDAMAKKTVIKLLLSKFGILSVEMQKALQDDQKVYDENGIGAYEDNKEDVIDEVVDPFADDEEDTEV